MTAGYDDFLEGLETADISKVVGSVTEDATLRVAVHREPFPGRDAIGFVLGHVLDGVFRDLRVRERLSDDDRRLAVFDVAVFGYPHVAEGATLVTVDTDGRVSDITVFLRPLDALSALADEMGRRMSGPRPE